MGDLIKKNNFVFKESDFDLGQKFDHMGYQETKFEAEALVRQAAFDKGLLFNIFRPGNIFGDSKTGYYPFDSEGVSHLYYEILDLIIETKISAQTRMVFDITPVDYVSKGILNLGLKQEVVNQTYHLLNPDVKSWRQIVRMIIELGFKIQLMSLSRYFRVINSPKMKQLDPRFNKIFSLMRYGFADARFFNSGAYCSSKYTAELLFKENIECPKIDKSLIGKFIESYQNRAMVKKMLSVSKVD
jgi:thioester reductase-like protein